MPIKTNYPYCKLTHFLEIIKAAGEAETPEELSRYGTELAELTKRLAENDPALWKLANRIFGQNSPRFGKITTQPGEHRQ